MRFSRVVLVCFAVIALAGCALTQPLANSSSFTEQQRTLAIRAYQQGDYHTAQGLFLKLTEPKINDPQATCYLAMIYYRQHHYQAALRAFSECQRHFPERQEVWLNAASTHIRLATELLLIGKSQQQDTKLDDSYHAFLEALLVFQGMTAMEAQRL